MNVWDRLRGVGTTIEHRSVTVRETLSLSNGLRHQEEMPHDGSIFLLEIIQRRDGFSRYDQNMRWSLRIDVPNRNAEVIFPDQISGNFVIGNALKQRFFRHVLL